MNEVDLQKAIRSLVITIDPYSVGRHTYVGEFTHISQNTHIGDFCSIGNLCTLGAQKHPYHFLSTFPFLKMPKVEALVTTIGSDVWIGCNSVILAGVTVGDGAVIGAGAVVTKDVPPYAIMAGNPARVLKYRFAPAIIAGLLETRWWELPDEAIQALPLLEPERCIEIIREKTALVKIA